jgi:hypothetical protein
MAGKGSAYFAVEHRNFSSNVDSPLTLLKIQTDRWNAGLQPERIHLAAVVPGLRRAENSDDQWRSNYQFRRHH